MTLIGRMVGAHRTSVTVALHRLVAETRVDRRSDGSWLLLGDPPNEVSGLDDREGLTRAQRGDPRLRGRFCFPAERMRPSGWGFVGCAAGSARCWLWWA
jgi:hypothetical protein